MIEARGKGYCRKVDINFGQSIGNKILPWSCKKKENYVVVCAKIIY